MVVDVEAARRDLAPTGVLRAGINLSNVLLVTGRTPDGDPEGVSPSMAAAIADRLGVGLALVPYPGPGPLGDRVEDDEWDIALIGNEPARAERILFGPAYVEILATYLVRPGSSLEAIADVDAPGVRIAVKARTAYDLRLGADLRRAELIRVEEAGAAEELFAAGGCDVLAGLRPALAAVAAEVPGSRILDGGFASVQQSIGTQKDRRAGGAFLAEFVEEAKRSGLVAELTARFGVSAGLTVAPAAGE